MMHGFLDFICSNNPQAVYLRKKIIFKIIPMLNPDGVVAGNYRTGLSGKDFNR
jgi:murein tripeptide amidase MpaA